MELRQLEYFQMASRLRNITRAAERLRVSQPNITVAIKKLFLFHCCVKVKEKTLPVPFHSCITADTSSHSGDPKHIPQAQTLAAVENQIPINVCAKQSQYNDHTDLNRP